MRILMVGDTHGNSPVVYNKAAVARAQDCDRMLILGDFGIWQGRGGMEFLDNCQFAARTFNIDIYALRGNHENTVIWNKIIADSPKHPDGWAYARSRVMIAPNIHPFRWAEKQFFVIGGAVSIDRQFRTEGHSYWPDEIFSPEELESVKKYAGRQPDYLLTHDCSDHTPWGFNLIPDLESQANRRRIDEAIEHLKPKVHFHGHMHKKFDWLNTASHGLRDSAFGLDESKWNKHSTRTFGLNCDNDYFSCGVLDTDADTFQWLK